MNSDFNNIIKLYTTDELAEILKISKVTVYRIVESRKITFCKIKGGIRFAENDILKYIKNNKVESEY